MNLDKRRDPKAPQWLVGLDPEGGKEGVGGITINQCVDVLEKLSGIQGFHTLSQNQKTLTQYIEKWSSGVSV